MISKKNTYKPKQENVVKLKVFIDKIKQKFHLEGGDLQGVSQQEIEQKYEFKE